MDRHYINLQSQPDSEKVVRRQVRFTSEGDALCGLLFLPKEASPDKPLPAAVVAGAWTSIKEQMAGTYARELAARGVIALAFDYAGWGESEGQRRYEENPGRKTADLHAAVDFLAAVPEVDAARISGVGVCASAGYVASLAADHPRVNKLAFVAPWLHTPELAEAVYGGAEATRELIDRGRAAVAAPEPQVMVAASSTDAGSLMYQAPYYTEQSRGLIEAYDNKFSVASWEPWLTYDALQSAERLQVDTLLICSEAAALPAGAHAYAERTRARVDERWLEDVVQFDFYDRADVVNQAADAIAQHCA